MTLGGRKQGRISHLEPIILIVTYSYSVNTPETVLLGKF